MKAGDRQQGVHPHFPLDFAFMGSVGFGCLFESPSHPGAQSELSVDGWTLLRPDKGSVHGVMAV